VSRLDCNALALAHGGWGDSDGSPLVCAESEAGLGGCSGRVPLDRAEHFCEAAGARLCTADELSDNEATGSGCAYDTVRVWSSTVCSGDGGLVGRLTQAGSADYLHTVARTCSAPEDEVAARCCADTQLYPPAPPLVTLEPPRGLRVVQSSCTNVSLQWEPPHGAYPAEGYVVDWVSDIQRLDGRPPAATGSSKGATQRTVLEAHALIGGLQPGTGYVLWVAARNAAGIGAWSSGLEASTRPADAPPRAPKPPVISSAPRAECATLRLRLPEEEQGSGCSAALSLALQYKSPSTRTWSIAKQHLLAGSEVVVDGLDAKLAYSYRLIAFNQAGGSEPSEVVGPVVVGMKEGFADSQPTARATSSASVLVDWGAATSDCQSGLAWKVFYRPAESKSATWKLLSASHAGTAMRAELECPTGCVFKVAPLVSGFGGSSLASRPTTPLPMRPTVEGAARLLMHLAISPDELPISSQEMASFESETAAVLAIPRHRVKVVEARPLASEWQVVFDLLPELSAKTGALRSVEGEVAALASQLLSVESKLFLGGVTRHANGTAGLHRLVPKRGAAATATAAATYDLVPVAASASLAPGAESGGRWQTLAALAALALCACTLLARRRSRAGRPHRYGLPGDTDLVDEYADDERGDDVRPQPLAAYRETLARETLGSPNALLGSPIELERYGAESRHAKPTVAEGQGAVEYF